MSNARDCNDHPQPLTHALPSTFFSLNNSLGRLLYKCISATTTFGFSDKEMNGNDNITHVKGVSDNITHVNGRP